MKKLIQTFSFILAVASLSAQDLIYTVSGEINQQKTSLDSILVENLSNDTRILFDNLSALEYYQINLSKNAFWGSVGASETNLKPEFVEIHNVPGYIQLKYRGITPLEAQLSVFNINGQLVYKAEQKSIYPNNSVRVQLAATGVYFVQIKSSLGTKTFRAVGSEKQTDYGVDILEEITTSVKFKSSFLTADNDFSYLEGDSIRISVYKEEYYARPSSFRIEASRHVKFEFRVSSVTETGTSDAYVALDENTITIAAYDTLSGQVTLEYAGENPDLKPGDIITVDVDTMGYLRKVVETVESDGTVTITTEQAYLNEVFVDKEIKLNTGLMNPGVQLKSTSSMEEISQALTDKDGYIHPVEMFFHNDEGKIIKKSALTGGMTEEEGIVPLIDFYRDISTDLYGEEGDDVHFYIDEGHVSLTSNAVFEFDLKYEGELDEDTKIKKGDLNTFKFYLDSEADFLTKLALDIGYSCSKKETDKLIDLKKVTAKFFVGPVIVWITFDVDIFSHYQFNVDAAFHSDWGFESNHILQIGGLYDRQTKSFTPIHEYTPTNTVYPLNVEGELNAFARVEIYPRAEVKFYGFFGPYAEIVPYIQGNYNAAFQSQITGSGTEPFLAWNSGIDLGMDFRVGTELTFLGLFSKKFGPTVINCFESPLWQSPTDISLLTSLPQEMDGGTVTALKFKVTDMHGNPVNLCPVYISGNGEFSKGILFTDSNGETTVNWTLPTNTGEAGFKAVIYKADKTVIKEISGSVTVKGGTSGETGSVTYEGKTYKTVKIGNQEWMAENLAYLPAVHLSSSESYTEPRYYVYGYQGTDVAAAKQQTNYTTYGVLYNWPAAMAGASSSSANPSGVQGICPSGWHLPSDAEWEQLRDYLIANGYNYDGSTSGNEIAKSLAAKTHWNTSSWTGVIGNNLSANNSSGFSALPGGYCDDDGYGDDDGGFYGIGYHGYWWSSTENFSDSAWNCNLSSLDSSFDRNLYNLKTYGYSIRCVRD
jgi:uncharacterized protein (TIGR02145 family)